MKTKLLLLLLFISSFVFAQIPTDQTMEYLFTGGSLVNTANPGVGDLTQTGSSSTFIMDRDGNAGNAVNMSTDRFNGGQTSSSSYQSNLTLSFWVKSPNIAGERRILQIYGVYGYGFRINQNGPRMTVNLNTSASGGSSGTGYSPGIFDNQWHHIVFRFKAVVVQQPLSDRQIKMDAFVDGVLNPSMTANMGVLSSSALPNFIKSGNLVISPTNQYAQGIDDIILYERALTNQEILYLNNGAIPIGKTFVDSNATGANTGLTWSDAFTTVQEGINAVQEDGEVWVKAGTYKPTAYATSQNGARDRTFLINKKVKIYGGFDGTEINLSERDSKTNITILSGDFNDDDTTNIITTETSRQDNAFHVVTAKGDFSAGGILDGFTITGGNASSTASDLDCATSQSEQYLKYRGAAIYVNPNGLEKVVYIKIKDCIIENNSANGMAVLYSFNPCGAQRTITNIDFESSIIRNNYSIDYANINYGASAYDIRRYGSIINCLIANNVGVNSASALRITAASAHQINLAVTIVNTTITNNSTVFNKVIKLSHATGLTMRNSIIYDNNNSTIDLAGPSPLVSDNIIEGGELSGNNVNPLLNNDYTLQATSPAVDAGNNAYISSSIVTDLLGNDRIYNATIDMGCYEYNPSSQSTYTLTTNVVGSGSVSPSGTTTQNNGAVVNVTATPATGWSFDGWSGASTSVNPSISITMDADKTLTATFSQIRYELTIVATNGTATPDSGTLANGVYTYNDGTIVEILATPNANYIFDHYEITDSNGTTTSSVNPLSITMNGHMSIEAVFQTALSIEDTLLSNLMIFPNPVKEVLNVKLEEEINNIEIFNLLGQKVIENKTKQINVSNLENGMYLLKINTVSNKSVIKKFIKQ